MLRLHCLLFAAFLTSTVLGLPVQHQNRKKSFKISRVKQLNYVPHGPTALKKAYTKFGLGDISVVPGTALDLLLEAASSLGTDNGDVTASPTQNDAEFLSPVSVGGQTLALDFDTGSSDMWVFNTQLPTSSQSGHTIFDPSQSSTFQTLEGSTFNITYGDGSFAFGPVGVDTVDVGGATVTQQALGIPTVVSSSFISNTASDGLLGLAFSVLNTIRPQSQLTFFDNVMSDLSQPLFTANLKHGTAGAYEFGVIDTTQFSGSLTTVPIDNSNGFWEFTSTQVVIGNGEPQTVVGGTGTAIADTGTSLLIVDPAVVDAYYSQVSGAQNDQQAGGVIFPCTSSLPDLGLAIGDSYIATVSGSLMNFAVAGTDSQTGEEFCFGGLQSNSGLGIQIYGDVFFKSQFVVFDGSAPSIQVAPHSS